MLNYQYLLFMWVCYVKGSVQLNERNTITLNQAIFRLHMSVSLSDTILPLMLIVA